MTEVTTLSQLEEPEVKQEEMKRINRGPTAACIEKLH